MTPLQATHHAHRLWCQEGIGVAVQFLDSKGVTQYQVGVCKDEDAMEVFGRSTESFEKAFAQAEGV